MKNLNLDSLRIASPCPVRWQQMSGDDRVRFCDQCSLHVYNISEMTRREAEKLIANTEGRICARLYRRSDGTVITRDCPIGLRAIRRRVGRVIGAAFATLISLSGTAFGQGAKSKDKESDREQVTISRVSSVTTSGISTFSGTIYDQNGADVAGADITISNVKTEKHWSTKSNEEGGFRMSALDPGEYTLEIKAPGFKDLVIKNVTLKDKEIVDLKLVLVVELTTMGIIVTAEPIIDTQSSEIKTIINGVTIRKRPLHQ